MEANRQESGAMPAGPVAAEWRGLCRAAGIASFLLLAYSLATLVQIVVLGGPPATAAEAFRLLQSNKLVGLLRLDLPTVFAVPLYYLLFCGLLITLWRAGRALAALSTLLAFVGTTLFLAAPSALSMLALSEKYAAATTDAARSQLLAAGEALLASDIWHSTGAMVGGILLQAGAVVISVVMLRGTIFGRFIAWLGILMHGADLAHILFGLFLPTAGFVLMALAGPFYPVWFFLVGRALVRAGRGPDSSP
jgi:hypothetical protein